MRTLTTTVTVEYKDDDGFNRIVMGKKFDSREPKIALIGHASFLESTHHTLETAVLMEAKVFRCTQCGVFCDTRHMSRYPSICELCEPQGDDPRDVL
jgi:hypothetical protein